MGIQSLFKSLFSSPEPEDTDTEAGITKEEDAGERTGARFPAFNPEMPVDVLATYSSILLSGRLEAFSPEALTIERIPGEISFPVQEAGAHVLVRGYDNQMEPFTLQGIITKSSLTECVVSHLEIVPHDNMRKSVRYPLSPPANIYAMEDTLLNKPQECKLLNISTGGACISSPFAYSMGDTLRLRVELIKNAGHTSYHCLVVRVTEKPGGIYEYGLLFEQLNKTKLNELLRDIETIQSETRKRIKA